jgi:glycosyltransferase involved in cell wall biosynthesis
MPSVLILVPAYNAAEYLPELLPRIRAEVPNEHILVVNDGSTDNTLDILKKEQANYLSFPDNRGKGAALMAGFNWALEHDYVSVLTIDADLQHLPEEIPRFLKAADGHRVVIGTRNIDRTIMPFDRWVTNNLTSLIISIFSRQRVRDSQSGYRLIPTELLRAIRLKTVNYDFESEMLFKAGAAGFPIVEVPISTVYEGSRSYINPLVDTLRFIRQMWKRIWA